MRNCGVLPVHGKYFLFQILHSLDLVSGGGLNLYMDADARFVNQLVKYPPPLMTSTDLWCEYNQDEDNTHLHDAEARVSYMHEEAVCPLYL